MLSHLVCGDMSGGWLDFYLSCLRELRGKRKAIITKIIQRWG